MGCKFGMDFRGDQRVERQENRRGELVEAESVDGAHRAPQSLHLIDVLIEHTSLTSDDRHVSGSFKCNSTALRNSVISSCCRVITSCNWFALLGGHTLIRVRLG